jgi:hypothetical protein
MLWTLNAIDEEQFAGINETFAEDFEQPLDFQQGK